MADVDIDPFGKDHEKEHDRTESRPDDPMGENIPLTPVGGSTWEPEREQETSFRQGESQRTKLMKDYIKDLYKKISENIGKTPEEFHYDYFKLEEGELYYRGKRKPLATKGKLKSVGMLWDILGKGGLCNLGFDIPRGKLTARQAVILNKVQEELPSASDVGKADDTRVARNCEEYGELNFSDVTDRRGGNVSHARTSRFRQTTQKHKRFAKGGGGKEGSVGRTH